jgi:hypothetical protein
MKHSLWPVHLLGIAVIWIILCFFSPVGYGFLFFIDTTPPSYTGTIISNEWYCVTAGASDITSIRVDPTGSFNYGENITKGLFIQNLYSTNGSSVSAGSNYVHIENLSMVDGTNYFTTDWQITLDGGTLKNRTICTTGHTHPFSTVKIDYRMEVPFKSDGYITNRNENLFHRFTTDAGQYLPLEMLKRLAPGEGIDRLFHCTTVRAGGTRGYDLNFSGNFDMGLASQKHFTLSSDNSYGINLRVNKAGVLGKTLTWDMEMQLQPQDGLPGYYPEFYTSGTDEENRLLNEFMYHAGFQALNTITSEMSEWMALKTAWTASPLKTRLMDHIVAGGYRMDTNGYVYTQGSLQGSLLLELYGPEGLDTRYFRNNPMFILAAHRLYAWTGDTTFLAAVMPALRTALDFIKTEQQGNSGLAIIDAEAHDGKTGSWGASSWYFETLPFGHKDALLNIYFYAALKAMAELELASSRPMPAASLETLADTIKTNFNNIFWDSTKGRYTGCIDIDGKRHDYGYVFINLQAIAYGLADSSRQTAIFQWLENEPTSSGTNDVFSRWVIAPRSSTINNPFPTATETNGWWRAGVNGNYDWEAPTHNGGGCPHFLFYEMLARIQTYGADNAWSRFTNALASVVLLN